MKIYTLQKSSKTPDFVECAICGRLIKSAKSTTCIRDELGIQRFACYEHLGKGENRIWLRFWARAILAHDMELERFDEI